MKADDLARVAANLDRLARSLESDAAKQIISPATGEAVLATLIDIAPAPAWRAARGPDAATVALLAKAIRILASMLAARAGAQLPIAGVIADLAREPETAPAQTKRWRKCLAPECGATFFSAGPWDRVCGACREAGQDGEPEGKHEDSD